MHSSVYRTRRGRFRQQLFLRAISCCAALAAGAGLFLITFGFDYSGESVFPVMAAEKEPGPGASEPAPEEPVSEPESRSGWQQTDTGWTYLDTDGNPVKGLRHIDRGTYYFADGLMQTGFCRTPGGVRFFGEDGRMKTGLFEADGVRFLAGPDGVMLRGWQWDGAVGRCYCFEDGSLAAGQTLIDGTIYAFTEQGTLVTGWSEENGERLYRDADGVPASGLTEVDGITYWFDAGIPQTGLAVMEDGTRFFDETGAMVTGSVTVNGAELQFGTDGRMMKSAEIEVPGILQNPELPNGCEVTSLAEVLRYLGFDVTHVELAKEYLRCEPMRFEGGVCYVSDPQEAYIGDPSTVQGWYCYEGPVVAAANAYFAAQESSCTARTFTGADEEELLSYLQAGTPVIVWVTQQLADVRRSSYLWTLPDGTVEHPYSGLHCVVLSGMDLDAGTCTLTDPIYGVWTAELSRFMEIYEQMGSRAVVIKTGPEEE